MADGSVWVGSATGDDIFRIDPSTNRVTDVVVGQGGSTCLDAQSGTGAIWVSDDNASSVSRIDPSTNTVVATIHVGDQPADGALGPDGLEWIPNQHGDTVSRIDPARNTVVDTLAVGSRPFVVRAAFGDMWVSNNRGTVARTCGGITCGAPCAERAADRTEDVDAANQSGSRNPSTKESSMRFIPTKFHAPLDYIVGAALIAAPWIFQFSEHTAATVVPIVLGVGLIAYSLFTNYELGVWKVAPMAVHNLIDVAAGSLLAASPWIFGFADNTANVWVPHLVVGIAAVFLGLTTKQQGGYSYRASTAVG